MIAIITLAFAASRVLIFPLMAQPLRLGLTIMISTLLICLVRAMLLSAWYAYILFLIYVGGLLVIFAYVAALSPNVLFRGNISFFFFITIGIVFSIITYFYYFTDYRELLYAKDIRHERYLKGHGIELINPTNISILIGLGIILLINLVAVIKISYYQQSSLRPFT